jgi:Flp pilus assembly protein TadG
MIANALRKLGRRGRDEQGSALVEMALVSTLVFFPLLFGIIEFSYGMYAYNWVNMAARQATRYAVVRGIESCQIAPTFPDCNMGPDTVNNTTSPTALTTYVRNLSYPGIYTDATSNRLTVTTTYLAKTVGTGIGPYDKTSWDTVCTSTVPSASAVECNTPGEAVQVIVTYRFPLAIPFWKNASLNLNARSQMVINE